MAAIVAGYAVEVDVQPAAGLVPVVFHDATLERLTRGRGRVGDLSPHRLAALEMIGTRDRILTLGELLAVIGGRTPLVIEVKTDWTGMAEFCGRIADVLRDYAGPVAVMSFDPLALSTFRQVAPALPRGIVAETFRDWHPQGTTPQQRFSMRHLLHCGRTKPHFIAYKVDDLPAVAPLALRSAFALPLLTWTVRTAEQRQRAERWADQMIFEGFRPEREHDRA